MRLIDIELDHLLLVGAIKKCKVASNQFVSKVFLAEKANGKKRFILNLRELNKFVEVPHFKMEDYRSAMRLIQGNCFGATLDLKDAYYMVNVDKSHRRFLRFYFREFLYEFQCLPFGLSTAPFSFTKIMKPIVQFLRSEGILCVNYLDDFLILGSSYDDCLNKIRRTYNLMIKMGFLVNKEKSMLVPSRKFKFLGFIFDVNLMTLELPLDKRAKILRFINQFLENKDSVFSIQYIAQFIGLLTSACPAVRYGWLYTKFLERTKYLALLKNNDNYSAKTGMSPDAKMDILWWKNNIQKTVNYIKNDNFELEISTDACLTGWGAACNGQRVNGWWTTEFQNRHINFLELQAIFLGVKSFAHNRSNCNILIRTDNTTALAYVNKMGSIQHPNLNFLARALWQWCEHRNLWVFASYIPSSQNQEADQASRILPPETEWSLNDSMFSQVVAHFGLPEVDLFASTDNKKCSRYISWFPDKEAWRIDAFTVDWHNLNFYGFPPFSLILRVLQKIINDKATGILIVPLWESQCWYPLFTKLIEGSPLYFGPNDYMLISPYRLYKHPLHKSLILVAARLSGKLFAERV